MSIMQIAKMVKGVVEQEFPEKGDIAIVTTPSDDNRSYHINSDKVKRVLGYAPKRSIEDAVRDLCVAFREGKLRDPMTDDIYYNVRRMKNLKAA
jgi:nucleoside-diphosphate-sugar epimerase